MCKILIVDDDREYLNSLNDLLTAEGHIVRTSSNSCDVIGMLHKEIFDIPITDIIMPDVDGLEIIHQVKFIFPAIKIIAISGGGYFSSIDLLVMAKGLGADIVVSKPFNYHSFADRLNALAAS